MTDQLAGTATATATATPTAPEPAVLRVASVPSSHVYVRHIAAADDALASTTLVTRLPDPHPTIPGRSAVSQWWPPRMLDAGWVRAYADDFDVFHIQFGFDAVEPAELLRLSNELHAAGKPLVYTAHDLRNPHHVDRGEHDAQLAVIMGEADEVITLTPGAAAEIRERWGRTATVIPHPHVVDFDTMAAAAAGRSRQASGGPFRIGLHVKSLRANMNPLPLIRALAEGRTRSSDTVLQVDGHPDVLEAGGARYAPELSELLTDYAARGLIDLRIHDYFTDTELWQYLESLDASVLPYRFGTHSGWLEACRDLGTAVIAPSCGYYAEQGPVHSYRNDETGFDADSLLAAVATARRTARPAPLPVDVRRSQREAIALRHEQVYLGALA